MFHPVKTIVSASMLAALLASGAAICTTAVAQETQQVAKAGWYSQIVNADFVKKIAQVPKVEGAMLIDSRPTARKFDLGHIQTAVNIPDSAFDKLAPTLLPADKAMLLVFYCDGPECMLSHNSAFKAEKLGYTKIRVYAEGYPDWLAKGHTGAISVPYLKKLIDEDAPLTLVDSRPKERKYDKGHIPGAISIPDLQFDKLSDRLPADKAAALYFYCEGLSCKLSSDSAIKARKLGYTKVMVVPEGYPAWEKLYGAGPTAEGAATPAKPTIQAGKESGTITVASFEKIFKEAPDTIHVVDVRDPAEIATGTFKGAIAFPINTMEKRIEELPSDKPIVFVCGTGARSGEAHDMAKLYRPALKTYFIEADIKWSKDGSYSIVEKK